MFPLSPLSTFSSASPFSSLLINFVITRILVLNFDSTKDAFAYNGEKEIATQHSIFFIIIIIIFFNIVDIL